jgi:hypothetical protein
LTCNSCQAQYSSVNLSRGPEMSRRSNGVFVEEVFRAGALADE